MRTRDKLAEREIRARPLQPVRILSEGRIKFSVTPTRGLFTHYITRAEVVYYAIGGSVYQKSAY